MNIEDAHNHYQGSNTPYQLNVYKLTSIINTLIERIETNTNCEASFSGMAMYYLSLKYRFN